MDITCGKCRRSYFVPDDLAQGRTFRAKCSQCGHAFAVDVPAAKGKKKGREAEADAPTADDLPSTSASAIPGFADALADADLGWLDEAAKKADAKEDEVFLLTVQRSRRGSAVAVAGGVAVVLAAAVGLGLYARSRGALPSFIPRAVRGTEAAAGTVHDVGGLLARPGAPAAEAPAPAPASAAGGGASPASRLKAKKLGNKDRLLLDLLARKEDAKPVGLQEDEAVDSEKSALDPAAAEKVIAANRRSFDACVSKALRLHPGLKLARRATMMLTVQPDGRVSDASLVEEQIARSDLGVCLSEAARRMVFPGFDGDPVEIAMPLSLSATF
ncbi:MAG TPA: AgmX/PglI C-terminal domain-containing protein [Anaeromyxobacter sp.]|nr:AgmX/PglI C-terminal domain-containing protein [Anaeromyxobacter sp.]